VYISWTNKEFEIIIAWYNHEEGHTLFCRDNSDGIATRYGLDCPGIKSRWVRDVPHPPDRPWGPPSLLYNAYQVSLPGI
jgi:hypothetical protein